MSYKTFCEWKSIECPHVGSMTSCSECSKGKARNPQWEDRTFRKWVDNAKTLDDYRRKLTAK